MLDHLNGITESEILHWIKNSVKTGSHIFSHGYQGHTYIYEGKSQRLIIKAPMGWGLSKYVRRLMLSNEYRVYNRLAGIKGVPLCYGFVDGRYLVLEFIEGVSFRNSPVTDNPTFFDTLLELIKEIHKAGVAHGDLKKKDNLLIIKGQTPCVVDFGVAIVRKSGFAPLNHYLYNLYQQFDYNAWAKLKYNNNFDHISEEDKKYYHRTLIEKVAGGIKGIYERFKSGIL
jgi:RIO-like serine/threonine protein kinase